MLPFTSSSNSNRGFRSFHSSSDATTIRRPTKNPQPNPAHYYNNNNNDNYGNGLSSSYYPTKGTYSYNIPQQQSQYGPSTCEPELRNIVVTQQNTYRGGHGQAQTLNQFSYGYPPYSPTLNQVMTDTRQNYGADNWGGKRRSKRSLLCRLLAFIAIVSVFGMLSFAIITITPNGKSNGEVEAEAQVKNGFGMETDTINDINFREVRRPPPPSPTTTTTLPPSPSQPKNMDRHIADTKMRIRPKSEPEVLTGTATTENIVRNKMEVPAPVTRPPSPHQIKRYIVHSYNEDFETHVEVVKD